MDMSKFTTTSELERWVKQELNKRHISKQSLKISWDELAYEFSGECYQHLLAPLYKLVDGHYLRVSVSIDADELQSMLVAASERWHELELINNCQEVCHAAN